MAFCSKCGTQLADGMRFCGSCGQVQAGETAVSMMEAQPAVTSISKMDRQSLLATFMEANQVLSAYESFQDALADEQAFAESMNMKTSTKNWAKGGLAGMAAAGDPKQSKRQFADLRKKHPKVFAGLILSGIGVFVGLVATTFSSTIGSLIMLAALVGVLYFTFHGMKLLKQDASVSINDLQPRLDAALYACERSLALNNIPPAYRYSYAMEQMMQLVQNFRANTWMECADRYEEMMHRIRMEAHAKETAELAALSAFYAKQARSNARASAIFSGLNFFLG